MSENISNGISVTTNCDDCVYLDNYDHMCRPCTETRESRLSVLAHELVDEDIYRYAPMYTPLLKISDNPSGSDWVASQTHSCGPASQELKEKVRQKYFGMPLPVPATLSPTESLFTIVT